jgi:hypothetical protein
MVGLLGNAGCPAAIKLLIETEFFQVSGWMPSFISDNARSYSKMMFQEALMLVVFWVFYLGAFLSQIVFFANFYFTDRYWMFAKAFAFNLGCLKECLEKIPRCSPILGMYLVTLLHVGNLAWFFVWKPSGTCVAWNLKEERSLVMC